MKQPSVYKILKKKKQVNSNQEWTGFAKKMSLGYIQSQELENLWRIKLTRKHQLSIIYLHRYSGIF